MGRKSIATKLLVALCSVISIALGVLVLVVSRQSSRSPKSRRPVVTQMARALCRIVNSELDAAFMPVRTLAQTLAAQKSPAGRRRLADAALREVAEANPKVLGIWTTWEPNAFDGLDARS
jgi:methyl-accepting chemotaxis protein